jgi:hypothetical protein
MALARRSLQPASPHPSARRRLQPASPLPSARRRLQPTSHIKAKLQLCTGLQSRQAESIIKEHQLTVLLFTGQDISLGITERAKQELCFYIRRRLEPTPSGGWRRSHVETPKLGVSTQATVAGDGIRRRSCRDAMHCVSTQATVAGDGSRRRSCRDAMHCVSTQATSLAGYSARRRLQPASPLPSARRRLQPTSHIKAKLQLCTGLQSRQAESIIKKHQLTVLLFTGQDISLGITARAKQELCFYIRRRLEPTPSGGGGAGWSLRRAGGYAERDGSKSRRDDT